MNFIYVTPSLAPPPSPCLRPQIILGRRCFFRRHRISGQEARSSEERRFFVCRSGGVSDSRTQGQKKSKCNGCSLFSLGVLISSEYALRTEVGPKTPWVCLIQVTGTRPRSMLAIAAIPPTAYTHTFVFFAFLNFYRGRSCEVIVTTRTRGTRDRSMGSRARLQI